MMMEKFFFFLFFGMTKLIFYFLIELTSVTESKLSNLEMNKLKEDLNIYSKTINSDKLLIELNMYYIIKESNTLDTFEKMLAKCWLLAKILTCEPYKFTHAPQIFLLFLL
jgi:hypothetical protein